LSDTTPVTTPAPPSPGLHPVLIRTLWIGATLLAGLIVPGVGAVIIGTVGAIFAAKLHRDRTLVIVLAVIAVCAALVAAWLIMTTFFVQEVGFHGPTDPYEGTHTG
jgi:hypothetical protein